MKSLKTYLPLVLAVCAPVTVLKINADTRAVQAQHEDRYPVLDKITGN